MAGLIGNYMGAAVGKSISDIGGFILKGRQDEETLKVKAAERLELERMRLQDKQDARDQNEQLRRDLAAGKGESGGGVSEITEGGLAEETIAARAGMSVPEYRAWRNAQKTGDFSDLGRAYGGTVKSTEVGEDGEGYLSVRKTVEYPEGFEDVKAARVKLLGEIQTEFMQGKNYKEGTEGRKNVRGIDLTNEALQDPKKAGVISQAVAAGEGKELVGGDSNVTRNLRTGETKTTAVGNATIGEKGANAKRDLAEIEKIDAEIAGGGLSKNSRDRLTTMVNSSNATIKSLQENPPPRSGLKPEQLKAAKDAWQRQLDDATSLRDEATRMLRQSLRDPYTPGTSSGPQTRNGPRSKPAESAPAPSGLPQGSVQIGTSGGKPVYQTPDGKRYIVK